MDRPHAVEAFLRDKAMLDAEKDHAAMIHRNMERMYDEQEQVMLQMQRDLEAANDMIRLLQGEKKTNEQIRLLYEEAKSERNSFKEEALAAATEAATLKRTLGDLQDRVRQSAADMSAQEQIAHRLFEVEELAKLSQREFEDKETVWTRERTLMLQQLSQLGEMRESVVSAYERGRRAAEDEAERAKSAAQTELSDRDKVMQGMEVDLHVLSMEKQRAASRAVAVPGLENALHDMRQQRNLDKLQHQAAVARLRDEVVQLQQNAADWKSAYESAEKHKKAMQLQLDDLSKAYAIVKHERSSLEARIELLQVQVQDARVASHSQRFM
ncbi:hypothetical protein DIPPA_00997 [Diplonema papillatum]|nr:hypothetical protein DIPPA_00997 [Diplonema papillatum]